MYKNTKITEIEERMRALECQSEFLNCQLCNIRRNNVQKDCFAYKFIQQVKEKNQEEYTKLCKERLKFFQAISKVDNNYFKTLLEYRYIYDMTCEEIAEITNYSLRQTIRKLQEATKELEKVDKSLLL